MHTQVHIQHLYVASAVLDTEDVRENEMETLWAHTQASRAGPNSVTLHRTGHPPPTSAHFSAHEQGPASGVKKQLLPALAGEENSLTSDQKYDNQSASMCFLLLETSGHRPRDCATPLSPQPGPLPEGRLHGHEEPVRVSKSMAPSAAQFFQNGAEPGMRDHLQQSPRLLKGQAEEEGPREPSRERPPPPEQGAPEPWVCAP